MKKLQDPIEYKFNEDKIFKDIMEHINGTYDAHYSKNKFQSTEFIVDCGHAEGFCIGNIIKYAQRFGKKDSTLLYYLTINFRKLMRTILCK